MFGGENEMVVFARTGHPRTPTRLVRNRQPPGEAARISRLVGHTDNGESRFRDSSSLVANKRLSMKRQPSMESIAQPDDGARACRIAGCTPILRRAGSQARAVREERYFPSRCRPPRSSCRPRSHHVVVTIRSSAVSASHTLPASSGWRSFRFANLNAPFAASLITCASVRLEAPDTRLAC